MKKRINYIASCFIALLVFSCNNDFLTEGLEISFVGDSSIMISPEWDSQDYFIYFSDAESGEFTITDLPDWLNISSRQGKFVNGMAMIHAHASLKPEFSKVGIYYAQIIVSVKDKNHVIPVAYVTEGNPRIETDENLIMDYQNPNQPYITIRNTGDGILFWNLIEYPEWLSYTQEQEEIILLQNEATSLNFILDEEKSISEGLSGKIVLKTNDKNNPEITIDIHVDLGKPSLYSNTNSLNFGKSNTGLYFELYNQGDGLLVWNIEDCPEWLTLSELGGMIRRAGTQTIYVTCDRAKLKLGINTATIRLKTNDKSNPELLLTVTATNATANPENVQSIEGIITDAWLDKQTDILYFTTREPNRFVAFDTKTKAISRQLNLDKTPFCFSVSEDGQKVVIGMNKTIETINLNNFAPTNTIAISHTVRSIAWGANDWVCYIEYEETSSVLHWVNTVTREKYDSEEMLFNRDIDIKKIPNKPYVIAARRWEIPTGIVGYDINTKERKINLRQDIGSKLWFSSNGNYIFDSNRNVYDTKNILALSNSSSPIATLDLSWLNAILWIDHNAVNNSLWVLQDNVNISQISLDNYKVLKVYSYTDYYLYPDQQDDSAKGQYIFANKAGNELIVIRNSNWGNIWSFEFIPVTK